jgi:hypothetical protein
MDRHGEKVLGLAEAGAGDKIVLADIKKFIGSLTPAQAAPIATKLTGPQITQVFAMKLLLK